MRTHQKKLHADNALDWRVLPFVLIALTFLNEPQARAASTLTRSLDQTCYITQQPIQATIQVNPDAGVGVWASEDIPPSGWTVANISHGGVYDGFNKKVKWGPFFDNQARTLTYDTTPPAGTTGPQNFDGVGSFDGSNVPITGSTAVFLAADPQITQPPFPTNQTVCLGSSVTYTVAVTGNNVIYQWQKDGTDIAGATSATLKLNNLQTADGGSYVCIVNDDCGGPTTSEPVILQVSETAQPVIAQQPSPTNQTVCIGSNVTYTIAANGLNVRYQWQKDNSDIAGATTNTLNLNNIQTTDKGSYTCIVDDDCDGPVTSKPSILNVHPTLTITQHPEPNTQTLCPGSDATFTAKATGHNVAHQWQKDGTNITSATNSTLALSNVQPSDAGLYRCVITDGCNNAIATNAATLAVAQVPTANAGPDRITTVDSDIQIGADPTASGGPGPYTFAWTVTPNPPHTGTIDNPAAANPRFSASTAADYAVQVEVTDTTTGCTAIDQANITVQENDPPPDPTQNTGTTDANGSLNLLVTDGTTTADITITSAQPGIEVTLKLAGDNNHGFTGIGVGDGKGVIPAIITLDGNLETGIATSVITICYDDADLIAANLQTSDIMIHRWNEVSGTWEPVGLNNVGESQPTTNLGDYGWMEGCAWAVIDEASEFIGADGCPDDPDKTQPGQCGCGTPDTDSDSDAIADCNDPCPNDANNDADQDSVCGNVDNCPLDPNPDQADADSNGIGDVCEGPGAPTPDSDGDGVPDNLDNCPTIANPDQADFDGDGIGNVCQCGAGMCGLGTLSLMPLMGLGLWGIKVRTARACRRSNPPSK